ncbi:hypothetical protein CSIRO_3515 [Bradyrhizobiaceae bacterium SG-6C]|nr:hypothetical protein CSIRO_3515 [Bradyrhizobiaceae bacterium SG-6C]
MSEELANSFATSESLLRLRHRGLSFSPPKLSQHGSAGGIFRVATGIAPGLNSNCPDNLRRKADCQVSPHPSLRAPGQSRSESQDAK